MHRCVRQFRLEQTFLWHSAFGRRPRAKFKKILSVLRSTPEIQITEREVHIWAEQLTSAPESIAAVKELLSKEERNRADRFCYRRGHDLYVAAHARLRQILSRYTGFEPGKLDFKKTEFGKPSLNPVMNERQIDFNLSHSGDWLLIGIARNTRIGVDIEEIRPESATDDVAARFFSDREYAELQSLPTDERIVAFFKCWTRKEAYLKALGCGLSVSTRDFDVTLLPQGSVEIRKQILTDSAEWSLFDLSRSFYIAAVAVEGKSISVQTKSG
jgi:4'-phosphopantetheinyl transferase